MAFTGNEEHEISFEEAGELTARYREAGGASEKGGFFGRASIEALLAQEKCVGIRYYYGLDTQNKRVLVLVGTDEDENDLVEGHNLCMEMSIPCPNVCGDNNVLNS